MSKMKQYQITLNESQLHSIIEALDQYARLSCMQFDESMLWTRIAEVRKDKYKGVFCEEALDRFRDEVQRIQRHYCGYGASWNASEFVKGLFYIKGSLTPILCKELKEQNPRHTCTRCDGVEWMGSNYERIEIEEVLNQNNK